jgi:protein-S-isoprenylcysteine O-methyltransferase Ste14
MVPMAEWPRIARRIRVPLGFAFAAFYLWIARPSRTSLAIGALVTVPGILLRALASGHVKKNEELTTSGPYAYTRNPLYLGSLIMALGFAIAARSLWVLAGMAIMFAAIYLPVIRGEESYLRSAFPSFDEYAQNVPRLLPRLTAFGNGGGAFSRPLYWQHREYNALLGTAALLAALVVKLLWASR